MFYDAFYRAINYEKEWLATCLQTQNGTNKFGKVISEIKSLGYKIFPPDINTSSDVWVYSNERGGFVPPLTAIKGVGSSAVHEIMERRPFNSLDNMLFTEDGKWRPSKMNKTCFDSLCKVEAFLSLDVFKENKITNHKQLHNIIVGNYDTLKKGRHGMTKTAAKKMQKEKGYVPEFLPSLILNSRDVEDWTRPEKIVLSIDLMSGVDESLVFPPALMKKIRDTQIDPITTFEGNVKGIGWFCIQEIIKKVTKNGKVFHRMKVCNESMDSRWLRVWGSFDETPDLYTIWLAELSCSESWGCSTTAYKMKRINIR